MIIKFIVFALINYLLASIPSALLYSKKFFNIDITKVGSKNPGASNVGRTLGKFSFIIVAFLDGLKAFIPIIIEMKIDYKLAVISSIFCIIGHCCSLFNHFKGGKGVATMAGVILAFSTTSLKAFLLLFVIPMLCWVIVFKIYRYPSLSSLMSILLAADMSTFIKDNVLVTLVITIELLFITYRHKENIGRLFKHEENKMNFKKKENAND